MNEEDEVWLVTWCKRADLVCENKNVYFLQMRKHLRVCSGREHVFILDIQPRTSRK